MRDRAADNVTPTSLSEDALLARLDRHFNDDDLPVIFWSHGNEKEKKLEQNGVVANHEYALNAVDAGAGSATLYNPWGRRHLEDVDIAFLRENFQRVRLLQL